MKPAILFDIDGTLLYAKGLGRPAFAEAFAEAYGVAVDMDSVSFVGATDTAIIRELAHQQGVSSTPAKEEYFAVRLTEALDRRLRAPNAIQVYPGVRTLLDTLTQRGFVLGLVTGNLRTTAWSKLTHSGLAEAFSFGSYASDHTDRNVLAQIACQRAADFGATPRLLIGDTPKDIQAAHHAGLPCLAVATGWVDAATLRRAGADALVEDFTHLDEVFVTVEKWCNE